MSAPLGEEMAVVTRAVGAAARARPRALPRARRAGGDRRVRRPLPRARRRVAAARAPRSPRSSCSPPSTRCAGWPRTRAALTGAHRFALPRALHPLTRASAGYAPVGVVGIRGARGAPFAEPLATVGAALLAGNGVVLAPAADARRRRRADRRRARPRRPPRGPRPRRRRLARALRRASLEEGAGPRGPDAMIVLADANARATPPTARCGARAPAAGQLAGSVKRVYVARERSDELLEALCARGAGARARRPAAAPTTQLGPLAGRAGRRCARGRDRRGASRSARRCTAAADASPAHRRVLRAGDPHRRARRAPAWRAQRVPGPVLA